MKKIVYLIVIVAIVVAIDHPKINQFYDNTIGQIKMMARDSAKSSPDAGAAYVYSEMKSKLVNYSVEERKAIKKITQTNVSVLQFQKSYCFDGDFNPVLYGGHMTEFCRVIGDNEGTLKLVNK
ncbi:MAG: hypothetical protein ACI9FJ_000993 [Alteromonadaceae bacterium]|jgi:hypothetical protein